MQEIVDNLTFDAALRLEAAVKLTQLQTKAPEPKPVSVDDRDMRVSWTPLTAGQRQAELAQRLHKAASKGDSGHVERILAIWWRDWPDCPAPQYQLVISDPVQTVTEKRMRQYAENAKQDQDNKLRAQLDWQAHHPIYRAGDRQVIPQVREWSGDEW